MGEVVAASQQRRGVGEKWMRWTFFEACTKTGSKFLQKVVGTVGTTFGHMFLATMVVGIVQVIAGSVMARIRRAPLLADKAGIVGSCLFGLFATFSTVVPFTIFLLGGEVGVNTFIITLSIIPGALIDRVFFRHRLSGRQWFGLGIGILAGYSILGWPSLTEFLALPLWVWLSFAVAMANAINQGITQKVKKIDPFVKNFWGGLTTLVLAAGGLVVMGMINLAADFSPAMQKLWLVAGGVGLIVVMMWTFNLFAYKGGASIAMKKLVMNGMYLTMAMIGGVLLFGEEMSLAKGVGVLLYFVAFALMDNNTWNFFFTHKTKTA